MAEILTDAVIDTDTRDYVITSDAEVETGVTAASEIWHALMTVKNRFAPAPDDGSELDSVRKSAASTPPIVRAMTLAALRPLVNDGRIRDLSVAVERNSLTGALTVTVTCTDSGGSPMELSLTL